MVDITEIVVAVIGLLSVILTSVVVPLIKSKLTNSQWESIFNAQGKGAEKFAWAKEYIEQQCAAHGIKIDADTVQIAIENAWKTLGLDQKQLPADKTVSEAE